MQGFSQNSLLLALVKSTVAASIHRASGRTDQAVRILQKSIKGYERMPVEKAQQWSDFENQGLSCRFLLAEASEMLGDLLSDSQNQAKESHSCAYSLAYEEAGRLTSKLAKQSSDSRELESLLVLRLFSLFTAGRAAGKAGLKEQSASAFEEATRACLDAAWPNRGEPTEAEQGRRLMGVAVEICQTGPTPAHWK